MKSPKNSTLPEKVLNLTEVHCNFCEITFYANWGDVERCPNCGSTDEYEHIKHVDLVVKKEYPC